MQPHNVRFGRREFLKRTSRATVAVVASGGMASAAAPLVVRASGTDLSSHPRISYFCNVMQGKIGGKPGEEVALTDAAYHTWAFSSLTDGRIVVSCNHPTLGWGYFLMTRGTGGKPRYERIACELTPKGLLDRVSVSPSEKNVCFEFQKGFIYKDPGRTLYVADFDAVKRTITNLKPIANLRGHGPLPNSHPGVALLSHQFRREMRRFFHSFKLALSFCQAAIERARCSRASPPMPKHCSPIGPL